MTQLCQTHKQKLILNRELEFQLQNQGPHQDCFPFKKKKKSSTTCSQKHLENTHVNYSKKRAFSILSPSCPPLTLFLSIF